ncbi:TetR/AcrR family transcriptional regulator [Kocuria sp.]|uniref:TetR/AcrR family transcriptional regulator n=1 Tax=Kocuria sp. TaxID=1871328 RepID=UPI0026DF614E|nr:TetR/AcrR family transcriptional regulator [Kocuria sp.]MDO5617573.1 TetR/AcrR family transcriptional regulator [Kocuria sp.]
MPKVSQEYRNNRRRAVVDAATDCFLAEGYRGASMHHVIAATGLSAGAIYNHFPGGKAELVLACANTTLDRVFELAQHHVAEPFNPEQWLVGVLEALAEQPRMARLLLVIWGEAAVDTSVFGVLGVHMEAVRGLISEQFSTWAIRELGLSSAEAADWVSLFSQAVLSVLHGWVVQSQLLPGFSHEAYVEYARTIAAVG